MIFNMYSVIRFKIFVLLLVVLSMPVFNSVAAPPKKVIVPEPKNYLAITDTVALVQKPLNLPSLMPMAMIVAQGHLVVANRNAIIFNAYPLPITGSGISGVHSGRGPGELIAYDLMSFAGDDSGFYVADLDNYYKKFTISGGIISQTAKERFYNNNDPLNGMIKIKGKFLNCNYNGRKEHPYEFVVLNPDGSKDYIGKALSVLSVSINAKDEAGVKNLEELFKKFVEPFVKELPFFKKHPENFEIHFRTNGNKVSVDLVSVKGGFLEPLLNLGINISDFHNFKASFKSEFRPDEFFTAPLEELSLKALQLLLSVKGNSTGGRYLLTALIEALKGVKLENAKFQKKLENHVDKLNALNAFLSFCFEFQFDAKELCGAGLEASKVRGLDVNAFLGMARTFVEALVENKVKPLLTQYALVDAAKATDIDEITVSLTFPKHENGVAHVVKLHGFSKAFCDKFLK